MDREAKKPKVLGYEVALVKARNYCARAERCLQQVEQKLRLWGVLEEDRAKILDALVEAGFVDELRFARAYAHDKQSFSAWGWRRIESELRRKGIDRDILEQVHAELEEQADEDDDTLMRLLEGKLRTLPDSLPYRKKWERLVRFGLYRGYEYQEVADLAEDLLE